MKQIKKIIYSFFIITLLVPGFVLGQSLRDDINQQTEAFSGSSGANFQDTQPLGTTVAQIINVLLGFLGILILAYLLYGGYSIMTSMGQSEKIDKGKRIIRNAIIGLLIIMSSWAITTFVFRSIGGSSQGGLCIQQRNCSGTTITASQCPSGSTCDTTRGVCVANGCNSDEQCPQGFFCELVDPQDSKYGRGSVQGGTWTIGDIFGF